MLSSAAYSSHPFFRFKTENDCISVPVSKAKTISPMEEKVSVDSFKSRPQKLKCCWVETGKPYPKMEMQWTIIESE